MILWLTTCHENALSPVGERVARDGAFTSRRGPGEGVWFAIFIAAKDPRSWSRIVEKTLTAEILRFAQDDNLNFSYL
jgi:hypothetical protein